MQDLYDKAEGSRLKDQEAEFRLVDVELALARDLRAVSGTESAEEKRDPKLTFSEIGFCEN